MKVGKLNKKNRAAKAGPPDLHPQIKKQESQKLWNNVRAALSEDERASVELQPEKGQQ